MKRHTLLILIAVLLGIKSHGQSSNSDNNISISGFNLCKSSIAELKEIAPDLKAIKVEEMDNGINCIATDSRFENGRGYSSKKFPGMIFQKEENSDLISKIRLTTEFIGNLPDGTYIDMPKTTAKDVLKKYPALNTWGSRDCSDYWSLSNDTISFFIRIEKTPRYPIDENYYLDKPVAGIDIVLSCYKKKTETNFVLIPKDPVFFIDSLKVSKQELTKYEPNEIASLTVYKDKNATDILGAEAVNGLIYIETKKFARERYWKFLKIMSNKYLEIVPHPSQEQNVVYVLNDKVLKTNFEGDLAGIDKSNLIDFRIINSQELEKAYNISDKKWGIILKTKVKEKQQN
ncbi:MAG: hypothetical protein EOO44_18740 [Flavobacterium sp.]|nr:MAG: hypothetical protein EOO44_18740 [Flavobacterium sp.]